MSSADKSADEVCASCGIKEGGDNNIKLKTCTACKLVKYCSVECQQNHISRHEKACKKRAAELRDELLFLQPECTHLGECPICFVPIPFEIDDDGGLTSAGVHICCGKVICSGCIHASTRVHGLEEKCPFCRTPTPENSSEAKKLADKQLQRGNPLALRWTADECIKEKNYSEAFKYYVLAAKGGDADAHLQLGDIFLHGKGVEKDLEKGVFHLEQAAIGGHPYARISLALYEYSTLRNNDRAVKHFIIGAKLGAQEALEHFKHGYKDGRVSKEAFEEALRGYQEAVNAMKTPQREAAKQNQCKTT